MLPTEEEITQALTQRVGETLQNRLKASTVAICGLGGLGSNIAISLARAGVGTLILIDFDRVDITNLNRQQYKASQIGMEKALALTENLREINPYLHIVPHSVKLCEDNIRELAGNADVICEAFDQAEQKSMLTEAVLTQLPHAVLVAASGMAGLGDPNEIRTRKISRRFYLCGDGCSDVDNLGSLFAPRVMLCAAHQATTVLRILTEKTEKKEDHKND